MTHAKEGLGSSVLLGDPIEQCQELGLTDLHVLRDLLEMIGIMPQSKYRQIKN